jgi:hypothetical protein
MAYKITYRLGAASHFWRDTVHKGHGNGIVLTPWLIYISGFTTKKLNCNQDNKNVYVSLTFIGLCIVIYSYSKNQPDAPVNYLLLYNSPHASDGLSVHHQEFRTVHTATGICQTDKAACLLAGTRWNCVAVCTVLNSWWYTERPSKTWRLIYRNK